MSKSKKWWALCCNVSPATDTDKPTKSLKTNIETNHTGADKNGGENAKVNPGANPGTNVTVSSQQKTCSENSMSVHQHVVKFAEKTSVNEQLNDADSKQKFINIVRAMNVQNAEKNRNSSSTRSASLTGHSHAFFFLPRTSTDPTDEHFLSKWHDTPDGIMMRPFPLRRGSMIVRSGRTTSSSSASVNPPDGTQAVSTAGSSAGLEGFIVTPFAQILVSMQRVRHSFMRLTAAESTHRFGVISSAIPEPSNDEYLTSDSSEYKNVANETLEELEWCLKQLENIQTKRPVSDMAFSKFKRLLNKELNCSGDADKSRHEISAYICGTFLECTATEQLETTSTPKDEKDAQVNQEIEQMMERRRSSGQSHASSGQTEQTREAVPSDASPAAPTAKVEDAPTETKDVQQSQDAIGGVGVAGEDAKVPINGIVTPNDKELDEAFTNTLDTWGADIFEIDRLSDGHALITTAYRILQKRDLLRIFSIDPVTLVRYLIRIESNYHADVPYHNALHAADVTQTSHYLLQAEALTDVFSDLEILAVIFASTIHDVDHPGYTNQFLVNTGHDLALQYNDASVLENHHLYVAFKLLNDPDCDIFASLPSKKRQTLRRMVIELVLATDMSKHMSLLADLRTMVETRKVSGSGVLNLDNYADRIQILQNLIHCSDLSNTAKPLRLNQKWTTRLMEEFFRQGDRERSLNLEISPMCDRESVAIEKSQVTFIDFVAHPLLESWCDLVYPSAQNILDILADNRDYYEAKSENRKLSKTGKPKLATAEEHENENQEETES